MFFGEEDVPGLLFMAHTGIQSGAYRRAILRRKVEGDAPHDWDRMTELRVTT